jgi:hypothetical protein
MPAVVATSLVSGHVPQTLTDAVACETSSSTSSRLLRVSCPTPVPAPRRIVLTPPHPSPSWRRRSTALLAGSYHSAVVSSLSPTPPSEPGQAGVFWVGIWGVAMQVSLFMIAYAGYWTASASQTGTALDLQLALHKRELCIPYLQTRHTWCIHPSRVRGRRPWEACILQQLSIPRSTKRRRLS